MAWSQYPLSARQTAEGDDIANLHGGSIDHDTVDEQLDQGAALLLRSPVEPCGDGGAEVFKAGGHGLTLLRPRGLGNQPLFVLPEGRQAVLQAATPLAQLVERQRLRRVSIHQALNLPRHLALTSSDLPLTSRPLVVAQPATLSTLKSLI